MVCDTALLGPAFSYRVLPAVITDVLSGSGHESWQHWLSVEGREGWWAWWGEELALFSPRGNGDILH